MSTETWEDQRAMLASDTPHRPGSWGSLGEFWNYKANTLAGMTDNELMERFFWRIMLNLTNSTMMTPILVTHIKNLANQSMWNTTLWLLIDPKARSRITHAVIQQHLKLYPPKPEDRT